MRKIIVTTILLFIIITPCHALTFFQTDYDTYTYTTTTIYESDWLPLRELSSLLPYSVEWKDRCIYIYTDTRTWEIRPDYWIPEGVKIENGVTYVTQEYMQRFIPNGMCFLYKGELYVFDGEIAASKLIQGDENFRKNALTTMYWIKTALPEDYEHIIECLTGGIKQSEKKSYMPDNTMAYVYPNARRPVAHIVASNVHGSFLAELIAHEAHHVWLKKINEQNEELADEYGMRVASELLELCSVRYENEDEDKANYSMDR